MQSCHPEPGNGASAGRAGMNKDLFLQDEHDDQDESPTLPVYHVHPVKKVLPLRDGHLSSLEAWAGGWVGSRRISLGPLSIARRSFDCPPDHPPTLRMTDRMTR